MKSHLPFCILTSVFVFAVSCSAPQYFHDEASLQRQKELQSARSANVAEEIAWSVFSIFSAAVLETDFDYYPQEQEFKKLNLVNPTTDTLYINMLTDVFWDKNDYCDFMDIRIPPKEECKVLVPLRANYNLYFSNTKQSDDDDLMQIYTSDISKIALRPNLHLPAKDSTFVIK